tara:strand:+ start:375 stop:632 length:258 start_codon:yes stop_codon:yes gene_type:complete
MGKNNKNNPQEAEIVEDLPIANPQGKTVEELKGIAQTLQDQLNNHKTMAVKAQGALEVILQMIPKQEVEEMIAQEAKNNGELVES